MPTDQATIDEAFQILLSVANPDEARVQLKSAIAAGKVDFYGGDKKIPPDWFESNFEIGVYEYVAGQWTVAPRLRMLRAVENFHTIKWTVSRPQVIALCEEMKQPKHSGGRPRVYDHADIYAVAVIALSRFFKRGAGPGAVPENYSGNDLAADVRAILGDEAPGDTQLGKILDPLLQRLKLRLKTGH
jgi:hypothetical protein